MWMGIENHELRRVHLGAVRREGGTPNNWRLGHSHLEGEEMVWEQQRTRGYYPSSQALGWAIGSFVLKK